MYDLDLTAFGGPALPVVPYVGLGIGAVYAQDQNTRFTGSAGPFPGAPGGLATRLRSNDGDVTFAYQAIIGASLPIPQVPGLSATLEYRFMGVGDDRHYNYQYFATPTTAFPAGIATRAKVTMSDDYNHSVLVGLRYAFNAAPPPVVGVAPPVAQQGVARTYLVFFDWDRADLTDRARQIIAQAAQATTQTQVTRIEVTGNTDTTGTARYNLGLSQRRAQNVAAELVRLGVPRAAITHPGRRLQPPAGSDRPGRARAAEPPRRDRPALRTAILGVARTVTLVIFGWAGPRCGPAFFVCDTVTYVHHACGRLAMFSPGAASAGRQLRSGFRIGVR